MKRRAMLLLSGTGISPTMDPVSSARSTSTPAGQINAELGNERLPTRAWVLTPEMFGAVGDGVSDDTEPVHRARDAAIASGASLYLPGRYGSSQGFHFSQGVPGQGKQLHCPRRIFGNGISSALIALSGCKEVLCSFKEISKASLTHLDLDCNNIAAIGLDTSCTYDGGAPSMGLELSEIRVLRHQSAGWVAGANNDLSVNGFKVSLGAQSAISADLNGIGGVLTLKDCVFDGGPIVYGLQCLQLIGCVVRGLVAMYNSFNILHITGGQIYPDPSTGACVRISSNRVIEEIYVSGGLWEVPDDTRSLVVGPGTLMGHFLMEGTRLTNIAYYMWRADPNQYVPAHGSAGIVADDVRSSNGQEFSIRLIGCQVVGFRLTDPAEGCISHDILSGKEVARPRQVFGCKNAYMYESSDRHIRLAFAKAGSCEKRLLVFGYDLGVWQSLPRNTLRGCIEISVLTEALGGPCGVFRFIRVSQKTAGRIITQYVETGQDEYDSDAIELEWPSYSPPRLRVIGSPRKNQTRLLVAISTLC